MKNSQVPIVDSLMTALGYKKNTDYWCSDLKNDPLNKNIKKLNLYLKKKNIKNNEK